MGVQHQSTTPNASQPLERLQSLKYLLVHKCGAHRSSYAATVRLSQFCGLQARATQEQPASELKQLHGCMCADEKGALNS